MINQRKKIFAFKQWILDLLLTTASFFLAYSLRALFELKGHTVFPVHVYLWILAIVLPTWACLLPLFRVYSEPTLPPLIQIWRLSKAIGFAGLVMAATISFVNPDASNRFIVAFTLGIDYVFLVAYRVVLMPCVLGGQVRIPGRESAEDYHALWKECRATHSRRQRRHRPAATVKVDRSIRLGSVQRFSVEMFSAAIRTHAVQGWAGYRERDGGSWDRAIHLFENGRVVTSFLRMS